MRQSGQVVPSVDLDALINSHFVDFQIQNRTFGGQLRALSVPIKLEGFPDDSWAAFEWAEFTGGYFKVSLLGTVYDFVQESIYNTLGNRFKVIAEQLYDFTRPIYGQVIDPDRESRPLSIRDVASLVFPRLGWLTFLGPTYVQKFGASLFQELPIYRFSTLLDGGILLQTRPDYIVDELTYKRWRKEVNRKITRRH